MRAKYVIRLVFYLAGIVILSRNYYEIKNSVSAFIFVWISGFYVMGVAVSAEMVSERMERFLRRLIDQKRGSG